MAKALKTNADQLLRVAVEVQPSFPGHRRDYRIGHDGKPHATLGIGGITYNLRVGDPALGWVADHCEPCVSSRNSDGDRNLAANFLSCVGNVATVLGGQAAGETGFVTGKHGGIEHIMLDFPAEVLPKLDYGTTIRIETCGQGLALLGFDDITVMSTDPRLLLSPKWGVHADGKKLVVPVAKTVPAKIMGSGLGAEACYRGDYDIQMFDESVVAEYGLGDLRLGDIVAILDADNSYGRIYKTGAVSIGVIAHGACFTAGHGPGVTTMLTSPTGAIVPVLDAGANLAPILGAGKSPVAKPKKKPGA
jgi:hypothetical protein